MILEGKKIIRELKQKKMKSQAHAIVVGAGIYIILISFLVNISTFCVGFLGCFLYWLLACQLRCCSEAFIERYETSKLKATLWKEHEPVLDVFWFF